MISIVPFTAKSAATLIAIGTDEIQMGPSSELGPIDPQIKMQNEGQKPAQAMRDFIDYVYEKIQSAEDPRIISQIFYPVLDKLDPWLIGQLERSVKAAKQYAHSLLTTGMLKGCTEEQIDKTVKQLSEGYFSHGYAIDRAEAKEMGLNITFIDDENWEDIWDLYFSYYIELITSEETYFMRIETLESLEEEAKNMKSPEKEVKDDVEKPECDQQNSSEQNDGQNNQEEAG